MTRSLHFLAGKLSQSPLKPLNDSDRTSGYHAGPVRSVMPASGHNREFDEYCDLLLDDEESSPEVVDEIRR